MDSLLERVRFTVQHQRVVLDVDQNNAVSASSTLTIIPSDPRLRTIYLNASLKLQISSVSLSSPTPIDPLYSTPASFTLSQSFQPLPNREPPVDLRAHPEIKRKTWAALEEEDAGELAVSIAGGWIRILPGENTLAPIEITINYRPVVSLPSGGPIHTQSCREWTPCLDSLWARCTWELIFSIPTEYTVASTGELLEHTSHPHSSSKHILSFLQTIPTSVQHVGFTIGSYGMKEIGEKITSFGVGEDLNFANQIMTFYSTEFGTYPFQDLKIAAIDDLPAPIVYASLILLPSEMICNDTVIEASIELRQVIALAIAQQWSGINIIPRNLWDTWLTNGIALHLYSMYIRKFFGNNEYRFRLKQDIDRCVRQDQGEQDPLCVPGTTQLDMPFINLKAPLVLHILDRHLISTGTSLGLSRIIPRLFLSALSDDLGHGNSLSTGQFFRICRKIIGLDLNSFAEQWVFRSGCPHFKVQATFQRKKFLVDFVVAQILPEKPPPRHCPLFEGHLTVRIHEADGAPFEHIIDIKSKSKTFTLPFNTKYKRTRRSGKIAARFRHLQEEMEAEEPELERADVFAYPPWDNEEIRQEWRVAEWSEEQADTMMGEIGGYEWIRIDPDCEWLAWFEFPQRPWYWISQLQSDRDVIAQLQAIQNLSSNPSPVVASELAKVALVKSYFYRIRVEAVKALPIFHSPESDYMGSFLLLKLLDWKQYNNFSDFADYFVRKATITALADLRNLPEAKERLIDVIRFNDNSRNPYDDSFYLSTAIAALGNSVNDRSVNEIIDRVLTVDRLVPSFQNVVTRAGIQATMKGILSGAIRNDPRQFLAYTREGSLLGVRKIAFDCLLACRPPGRSNALTRYIFEIILNDSSLAIRSHVAVTVSEAVLASLAVGEVVSEIGEDKDIVKSIRKEVGKKPELRNALQSALLNNYTTLDGGLRLALIKAAELLSASIPEPPPGTIITLQTPVEAPLPTPKIRFSLGSTDFPFPQLQQKKKAPKTPRAGLADADLLAMRRAFQKLRAHKQSSPFQVPVDPVRDNVPDYPTIVKQPMDLSTIAAKIDSNIYRTRAEFADDVRLICSNCLLYNQDGSHIFKVGQAFQKYFEDLWAKTEATLNSTLACGPLIHSPGSATPAVIPIAPPLPTQNQTQPKIKLKPINTQVVPPMAPPPIPLSRKPSEVKRKAETEVVPTEVERKPKRQLSPVKSAAPIRAKAPTMPSNIPPTHDNTNPMRLKRAKIMMANLARAPGAIVFARPVDPTLDGCPTYLDEIAHPMDFGTINQKIDRKAYSTMGQLAADIELVFENCRTFNPPGDITTVADTIQRAFWEEWKRAGNPDMNNEERKAISGLLVKLVKDPISWLFREPVDPVALNIPGYFDIIPREEARDISLIQKKLKQGVYATSKQVDDDVEMMLNNARIFNGEGEVTNAANDLGRWWRSQRKKLDA